MLVLTRKNGEELLIGGLDGIRVRVIEAKPGRVRLGIEAPGSVAIERRELMDGRKPAGSKEGGEAA